MKKIIIVVGISVGALFVGAISFSIFKAIKWSKHFGMTYFEFSYQFAIAIKLLQLGRSIDMIKLQTGIDFNYKELAQYFLRKYAGNNYGKSSDSNIYNFRNVTEDQ
jgi:hypothetical protein